MLYLILDLALFFILDIKTEKIIEKCPEKCPETANYYTTHVKDSVTLNSLLHGMTTQHLSDGLETMDTTSNRSHTPELRARDPKEGSTISPTHVDISTLSRNGGPLC